MSASEIVDGVLEEWSDAKLVHCLRKLEGSIEKRGYNEAAVKIGNNMFSLLRSSHADKQSALVLKQVKGKIVLRIEFYCSDSYDVQCNLREWIPRLKDIGNETGVECLHDVFSELFTALEKLKSFERLESRTSTKGEGVEIISFLNHFNVHLEPMVFESLYGFLKEYCPPDYVVLDVVLPQRK